MKIISKIWMIVSLISIVTLSVITNSSILQIIAAVCGVIYVFSNVLENKYGQLFGMVNSALYGIIMHGAGVYGTAIYDFVYCVPIQIYTFFTWGKNKQGEDRTVISRYTRKQRALLVLLTILVILVYYIIATALNVQFALVDGISIILGILGLYMTSKKKIEQWYTFIISNIAMIFLWTIKCIENISNIPMLVMWVIYIINSIYGLFTWNKKLNSDNNTNNKVSENATV